MKIMKQKKIQLMKKIIKEIKRIKIKVDIAQSVIKRKKIKK